ncbi:MAG TPA: NUDIX domain-containing protein [Anaerolineaceae bacterium]
MGYISELRTLVGHRPLLMVGAGIIFLDERNRALLFRREDNGLWSITGGALEPGETVEETARREAFEETGLAAGDLELLGVFSGPESFHTYPNGDQVYNVTIVYLSRLPRGEMRFLDGEVTEVGTFSAQDLPGEISPPDRPILQAYVHWLEDGGNHGRGKSKSQPRPGADTVGSSRGGAPGV